MLTLYFLSVYLIALFSLFYIYFGYPLALLLITRLIKRPVKKEMYFPSVTILIPAYNEEEYIETTIKNKLELDYPRDKLEIIVISDNSTDSTEEKVGKFKQQGVTLLIQSPRKGKTAALNLAHKYAKGEIILFSDANSIYNSDAIKHIIKNFKDPDVGYVTGKMIYVNEAGSVIGDGCTNYMKYENFLRSIETRLGSIVGVDGGIDAIRKSLYVPMREDQLPDFILPLHIIRQGFRVVYEPKAILREVTLNRGQDEYKMRVRVALRALWALVDMKSLFNIFRYGFFSFQLISHKLLRYLGFIFIFLIFFSNIFLISVNDFFLISFILQIIFYLLAFLPFKYEKNLSKIKLFYIPYYFTLVNIGFAEALIKFILRKKQIMWTPRKG